VHPPAHGTVEITEDGHYTYQHNGSPVLQDEFTYAVINEDDVASFATVYIEIEPPMGAALVQTPAPNSPEPATLVSQPAASTDNITASAETPAPAVAQESTVPQEEILQETLSEQPADSEENSIERSMASIDDIIEPTQVLAHDNRDVLAYVDEVIQHRAWKDNHLKITDTAANLLNTQSGANQSLSELFNIDYEQADSRKSKMTENLDDQRDQLQNSLPTRVEFATPAVAISSGLSVGYLVWLVRGGVLLGSVMSSMPAWRTFDPLPVLDNLSGDDNDDSETLESMVEASDIRDSADDDSTER